MRLHSPRTLVTVLFALATGAATLALTGCGAPRANDVYRPSALAGTHTLPTEVRLSPAQQQLRQLAMNAHRLQPSVRRPDASATDGPMVELGMRTGLYGCQPDAGTELTISQAGGMQSPRLASVSARL
jgi:hypothetical protein